jgi:hypothetical protein
MKKGMNSFSWGNRTPKTTIFVSLPAIRSAAIAGSGDMKVDRVEGNSFAGSIAGSGDLQVAALRTGEAEFSIAGSGNISAAGNAKNTDVSVAGSGNVDLDAWRRGPPPCRSWVRATCGPRQWKRRTSRSWDRAT